MTVERLYMQNENNVSYDSSILIHDIILNNQIIYPNKIAVRLDSNYLT